MLEEDSSMNHPWKKISVPGWKFSSPNVKKHWTVSAKENDKKNIVLRAFLKEIEPLDKMEMMAVKMIRIAPRELDDDNFIASCKALRDCIADYLVPGLAPGRADNDWRLTFYYSQRKGAVGEYALEIELYQLLENSNGPKKQSIAIALSEARKSGAKIPLKKAK